MTKLQRIGMGILLLASVAGLSFAQFGFGGGGYGRAGRINAPITSLPVGRSGVPEWKVDPQFKSDVFTFVRLKFTSVPNNLDPYADYSQCWKTDWPSADLNFSYRLQQMTSMKVSPNPIQLEITDPRLFDYPFVHMEQVGWLQFSDEEVLALRRYLLNGGFLEVGDHWGPYAYQNFHDQMKRVFQGLEPRVLGIEHPIFHCVFDLKAFPQVPEMEIALRNRDTGVTWEREDGKEPIFRGIFDDKGRMMVLICSNTDLMDGWEKEGVDEWFFHEFCEKKAYPMAINMIFYALTH